METVQQLWSSIKDKTQRLKKMLDMGYLTEEEQERLSEEIQNQEQRWGEERESNEI